MTHMIQFQEGLKHAQFYVKSLCDVKPLEMNRFSYYVTFLTMLRLFTFLIVLCTYYVTFLTMICFCENSN